jgi:hypothetical protein
MKTMTSRAPLDVLIAAIFCVPILAFAADTNSTPGVATATQTPTAASQPEVVSAPVKLPYGVEDILKLSRAQVGDEITLNYIRNSGTIYNLGPQEIVYLRSQGVSERVVNAMLDQRKLVAQAPQPAPEAPVAPATAPADATVATATTDYSQVAPVYTEPAAQPASTVYVIPSPSYSYPYYYGYYPYYPYYYGGPYVSFGFGYYGGYYGRGCYYYPHGYYGHGGHWSGGHGGGHWSGGGHGGGGHGGGHH